MNKLLKQEMDKHRSYRAGKTALSPKHSSSGKRYSSGLTNDSMSASGITWYRHSALVAQTQSSNAGEGKRLLVGENTLLTTDHVMVLARLPPASASSASLNGQKSLGVGVRGVLLVTNYRMMFDAYGEQAGRGASGALGRSLCRARCSRISTRWRLFRPSGGAPLAGAASSGCLASGPEVP